MTDAFTKRFGFPRAEVTLDNWRLTPWSRWSFQNVGELVPSAVIKAQPGGVEPAPADASGLLAEKVKLAAGTETVRSFLERTETDALVVMKAGRFVADYTAPACNALSPHIVFSISKSLTAILIGIAQDEGKLDPEAQLASYMPEMAGSAYGDASVQNVLDMRVSLDFEEVYLDPMSPYGRYRRAMLWNPPLPDEKPDTMPGFLASLQHGEWPHGGPFRYRSPNSDLLALLAERVMGERYADLLSRLVWDKIGAVGNGFVTVDRIGSPRGAGGVSMTARDLVRVGEMLRNNGQGPNGRVVSARWVEDTFENGDPAAWLAGDFPYLFPEGRYRNQWYAAGKGALCAIGIHGQWLWVDPASETVIVRVSSQPVPVDDPLDLDCVALFRALPDML